MNTIELKSSFHKLIDEINNDEILNKFYDMLHSSKDQLSGTLWQQLSEIQKKELIDTEGESSNEENLISNEKMKLKNKKWL